MIKKRHTTLKTMPAWTLQICPQAIVAHFALTLLMAALLCSGAPCHDDHWWNSAKEICIKCTECEEIVLRTCQPHKDTICGKFDDLGLDWNSLARTEKKDNSFKENRKTTEDATVNNEEIVWDWQAASLAVAAIACLMFFIAATIISIQHARQWRRMEKRFDADMEEMSARLMSKLAHVQNLENGAIIIEEPITTDRSGKPFEVRCVYLEQLLAGRKNSKKSPGPGNVYIEETGSSKGSDPKC